MLYGYLTILIIEWDKSSSYDDREDALLFRAPNNIFSVLVMIYTLMVLFVFVHVDILITMGLIQIVHLRRSLYRTTNYHGLFLDQFVLLKRVMN